MQALHEFSLLKVSSAAEISTYMSIRVCRPARTSRDKPNPQLQLRPVSIIGSLEEGISYY